MYFACKRNGQTSGTLDELLLNIHTKLSSMTLYEMQRINPITWNMILNGMSSSKQFQNRGLYWFDTLAHKNILPEVSEKNLSSLLNACGDIGNTEMAMNVFGKMKEPTLIDYTMVAKTLVENHKLQDMVVLVSKMTIVPDAIMFSTLVKSCTRIKYQEGGKTIHQILINVYPELLQDIPLVTSLINCYTKCKDYNLAIELFKTSPNKNIITWNCYLQALIAGDRVEEAFQEFDILRTQFCQVHPTNTTYGIMLNACITNKFLERGETICQLIEKKAVNDVVLANTMINFYSDYNIERSINIFNSLKEKDTPVYNTMIQAYFKSGREADAFSLFYQLKDSKLQRSEITFIIMLDECAGRLFEEQGEKIASMLPPLDQSTVQVSNSLLKFYCSLKKHQKAADFLSEMIRNNKFDFVSLILILSLYADGISYQQGFQIHKLAIQNGFDQIELHNAIINFYGKVGEIDISFKLFEKLLERDHLSIVTWNTMLAACAQNGKAIQAQTYFEKMISYGFKPNEETFLHMLTAYSHCMMPQQSSILFKEMSIKYNMEPTLKHKACLIDGLVRVGMFEEAEKVIGESRDIILWGAYLGGCRKFNDLERGKKAFHILKEIDKTDASNYVLLANIYSFSGEDVEVEKVKTEMRLADAKKIPGISTVEIDGVTHSFVSDHKKHPEIKQIEQELMKLTQEILEAGYEPDTRWVTRHGIKTEEEKRKLLYRHSEKIAMAYAFIHQPKGSTVRIAKNLRVCGDCHNATKYISLVRECKIIVRDAWRFHHFENGKCSCGDSW